MADVPKLKQLKRLVVFVLWFIFVEIVIVGLGLYAFGAGEFERFFDKTQYYYAFGALSLIGVVTLHVWKIVKPSSAFANSFVWNPEDSLLEKVGGIRRINRSLFWSFLIFLNLTLGIGLLSVYTNTFYLTPLTIQQQVTTTGRVLLGTEPAAFTETLSFVGLLLPLLMGFLRFFTPDNKLLQVLLIFSLLPLLIGLFGTTQHLIAYGENQPGLFFTFLFWTASAYIALFTGSILAAWLWHFNNNLFAAMHNLQIASGSILGFVLVFMLIFNLVAIMTRMLLTKKFKKRAEVMMSA